MGAMPWQHLAPWDPNPLVALRKLQAAYLAENYDFPSMIDSHLESARESVRITEEEGDEYGILDIYQADLQYLEDVASKPLPTTPEEQITVLRQIWASDGEGIGNVLDVKGVTAEGGVHVTRRMTANEVAEILGTPTPTPRDAERLLSKIADDLERGESVCFPVYDDNAKPCGWWFAGYTVD